MAELNIKYQYPYDPRFIYETKLERINLDEARVENLSAGKGFIISDPQSSIKKDLKNPNGIYSTRYGTTLEDINPFADRYKCHCGYLKSRIYNGIVCPKCGTTVKYVDDDFSYFGWIVLNDPYWIIHPNLYKSIEYLLGQNSQKQEILDNILLPVEKKDIDGHTVTNYDKPEGEPFYGIGILEFKERIEEILEYYVKKAKNDKKRDTYEDILKDKDKIFTQSIPVYTTYLRPYTTDAATFYFEGTNAIYNIMVKLAVSINKDKIAIYRKKKSKKRLLYDLNLKYQKLYKEIENIISGKKGTIRTLFGGRYNFTSRDVIVPNPKLRIDEVTMPYKAMVELMQQTIINFLQKSYNYNYSKAYEIWYEAQLVPNPIIKSIIREYIRVKNGLPILLNRNPTMLSSDSLNNVVA